MLFFVVLSLDYVASISLFFTLYTFYSMFFIDIKDLLLRFRIFYE